MLIALAVVLVGAVFGVIVAPEAGAMGPFEIWLIGSSGAFAAVLLAVMLIWPFDRIPWVIPYTSSFFCLYLTAGALLSMRDASVLEGFLVYLLWFFPLLALNRFVNIMPSGHYLSWMILLTPLLLVVARLSLGPVDMSTMATLVVYALSYIAFALIMELFTQYREAWVHSQEQARSMAETQAALQAREAHFRQLFSRAAAGIGWLSPDGLCQDLNQTFCAMLGLDTDDAVGRDFADLLIEQDRTRWQDLLKVIQDPQQPEQSWQIELGLQSRAGHLVRARMSFSRVENDTCLNDTGIEAIAFVCQDDTETFAMEQQLRQAQRLEAVGQLTGGVAHDFNNLLTVIIGNAELLEESLDGELAQLAAMNRRAAERGAALTAQLLAFSRRQSLAPEARAIGALLDGMLALLRRSLGEHVELELVCAPDLWPALADATQLESALLNLSLNARDAMPNGGQLLIEASNARISADAAEIDFKAGDYVCIAVTDTGTGMSPELQRKVFEPFFTTKAVGKGSGLGLSMVYGFIKQSDGQVRLYSEPGVGTTVKLFLPRAESADVVSPRPVRPQQTGQQLRVLLVEDDNLVRDHVSRLLKDLGHDVRAVTSGPEALQWLQGEAAFDLMFTDLVMPGGIDGAELIERALVLRPGLSVLLTSGYTEHAAVRHGRVPKGVRLLSKPYRLQELEQEIQTAVALDPAGGQDG